MLLFPPVMAFLSITVLKQFVVLVKLCSTNNQTITNCLVEVLDIQKQEVILANADLIIQFADLTCFKKSYLTFNIRMNIACIFTIKSDERFSLVSNSWQLFQVSIKLLTGFPISKLNLCITVVYLKKNKYLVSGNSLVTVNQHFRLTIMVLQKDKVTLQTNTDAPGLTHFSKSK